MGVTIVSSEQRKILEYFRFDHLPPNLQEVSRPFLELAWTMFNSLKESDDPTEIAMGLRKLLEAKDCFVRAALQKERI